MPVNNAVTITRASCNQYTITNNNEETNIGIRVDQLVNGAYVEGTFDGPYAPAATATVDFDTDGVYRIVVATEQVPPGGTYIKFDYYEVVIYCAVQTCMVSFIKSLICSDDANCAKCQAEYAAKLYYYNALMATWYTFLIELNSVYVNNWAYTVLDPNDLDRLTSINTLITKMASYCACLDIIDGTGDCGCGCS